MGKRIRVGLIGLGKMGKIRFDSLSRRDDVDVVIGTDPDASRLELFPGIRGAADHQEVIDADVDAIFVGTPNRFTPDIVVASLEAGKHVFSEKPPGRTVADIERIQEAEQRVGDRKLKFGFNHRYHGGVNEALRIVRGGRLGEVLWLRGVYGKSGGDGFASEWRSRPDVSGGGILLDQGIHMIDLFRLFCGDFVDVRSMVSTAFWNIEMEDNAFALLRTARGNVAMLHSSSTQWKHRFQLEIYMSRGSVSVNGLLTSTRSYGEETVTVSRVNFSPGAPMGKPTEETIFFDTDPSWDLEVAEFIDAVRDNGEIQFGTSEDARAAMEIVYRIYQADEKWVRGDEVTRPRVGVEEMEETTSRRSAAGA